MENEREYPTIDMKRTGQNLKRITEDRGLNASQLQSYLGLACVQTIYRWYAGSALPSLDNLLALSRLFQVSMDRLIVENRFLNSTPFLAFYPENAMIRAWEQGMRLAAYQNKMKKNQARAQEQAV